MKKFEVMLIVFLMGLFLVVNVTALYTEENTKVSFGHVLRVHNIDVTDLSPGSPGILTISLKNNAEYPINDVRAKLNLPSQLQFVNDANEVRLAEIKSGETKEVTYKIMTLPTSDVGIYGANLIVNYVSHFGANYFNVGEENQDNYSIGIMIKSNPSVFVQVDSNTLNKNKLSGDITFKFVNNGTANIKFLTVELSDGTNYQILTDKRNYIGDLDSNDFQTAKFTIKASPKTQTMTIPIKLYYRDSINNDYFKIENIEIKLMDSSQLAGTSLTIIPIAVVLILIGATTFYYIYVRYKRRR